MTQFLILKKRSGNVKKIFKYIKNRKVDILVFISFFIMTVTTISINIYVGLYLIAALLFIIAIIITRYGGE